MGQISTFYCFVEFCTGEFRVNLAVSTLEQHDFLYHPQKQEGQDKMGLL